MDWLSVVENFGFAAVCVGACAYFIKYMFDKNREDLREEQNRHAEEIAELTEVLRNNTAAISELTAWLKSEKR